MKWPLLVLLLPTIGFSSCQTAHDAAVAGFRVLDAPHQYIRQKLDLDQSDNPEGTSTTTVQQTNVPPSDNVYSQPYQQTAPPPPPPPPRYATETIVRATPPPLPPRQQTVVSERTRVSSHPATPTPSPIPRERVTTHETTTRSHSQPNETRTSTSTTTSHTTVSEKGNLPYAKPVPGKPGYVFSPFDPNGGYVDVTGFAPGSKVKDPYSGKVFLVP